MKQVININFQGRVVPIEVTAFDILKIYIESLNRHFSLEEGREEIINDIENRIGELFQERLKKGATCITDDDVNAIIRSMGRPEDLDTADPATSAGPKTASASPGTYGATFNPGSSKRFYRDENHKAIGGVCSGLANYFNVDVVVVRIIFVLLGISFGFGVLTYLILWIAVPSSANLEVGGVRKRLFRDHDEKIVAGVCSGIANYFGINAWIPRILFLLPFVGFLSRWGYWGYGFPDVLGHAFSPGALIVYVILWLVIPEAFSTSEKLEMKGAKVDMNSIKNSVMQEMQAVQQRAEKFSREARGVAAQKGAAFSGEVSNLARRSGRSLGDVIALLVKIFVYIILGFIGLFLVMALFGIAIAAIGLFPLKDFVLTDGWQNIFAWGTLIFFIAVPIIGIITWIVRRVAKIRSNRKTMRFTFFALWLVGIMSLIGLAVSISRDFRSVNNIYEQEVVLENPGINKLEITSNSPVQRFSQRRWFRFEPFSGIYEDTAIIRNISVQIARSTSDSFKVTMLKIAHGRSRRTADTLASLINFNAGQVDSLLVIDKGFAINRHDKFRNQQIVITVYVPVGKQIRVNRNVGWDGQINFGGRDDDWDNDFGQIEHGWDYNRDYVMRVNGLFTLNGEPADEWRRPDDMEELNSELPGNQEIDNGFQERNNERGRADSGTQQPIQQEMIQKNRDSMMLEKAIEERIRKAGVKTAPSDSDEIVTYSLPGYNPMRMMK